jgi:hypothetical protein
MFNFVLPFAGLKPLFAMSVCTVKTQIAQSRFAYCIAKIKKLSETAKVLPVYFRINLYMPSQHLPAQPATSQNCFPAAKSWSASGSVRSTANRPNLTRLW